MMYTSRKLGEDLIDGYLLTHAEWNGMPEFFSRGSNETGVRRVVDGEVVPGSFELIQHGWNDWRRGAEIIKRGLQKGWDTHRICRVMDFIKERVR